VAQPEAGGTGLNEPVLLGRGQNGETQRGKTVSGAGYASLCIEGGRIMDTRQIVTNYHNAWTRRLLKKPLIQAVQKCPDARPPKS